MATKVRTNVYLDKELKEKAKELFKEHGLSLSDALNIFLAQVVRRKDIPLEEIVSDETLEVIRDAREGKNMIHITLEELKETVNEATGGA